MPAEGAPTTRPRPGLLVALGIAIVALMVYWMWPEAGVASRPSNQARDRRAQQTAGQSDAASLQVGLDKLQQPPPQPRDAGRNPFRFQPKAPPAPPPRPAPVPVPTQPVAPPQPIGPPPIPLKFFGVVEDNQGKIAALTDGRSVYKGREGAIIEGRYRIVKIGVESIVMEYTNGTGRQTIPLRGQ
jgi:hypothetical protein